MRKQGMKISLFSYLLGIADLSAFCTCHWCHVMARESFEDEFVSNTLNDRFISIKVDREERPDVDAFCMSACQLMTGAGGWPLTVFMTGDRTPFYAGTYFPQKTFIALLDAIDDHWKDGRDLLLDACEPLLRAIEASQRPDGGEMSRDLLGQGYARLMERFDEQYGGFGRAPKFPTPHVLLFLLRYSVHEKNTRALYMAEKTLADMAYGGMYDHIGGGFCRYSTDRKWLAPHFEKMLYDNALLALAYTQAHQITKNPLYERVATETLNYLLREMRDEGGGFKSAQDADSGGREGAYYVFTPGEVITALGEADGKCVCEALSITPGGNFEGKSIPNRVGAKSMAPEALRPALDALYEYRLKRIPLSTDDKILTGWNALGIVALCAAAAAFARPDYLQAAKQALSFIEGNLTGESGGLFIRWRDGERAGRATLDDYAFLCWASIALYDATLDPRFMEKACVLIDEIIARFGGERAEGYFLNEDSGELALRVKEGADNAMPCGNSVLAYALARVSRWTDNPEHERLLEEQLNYVASVAKRFPDGCAFGLIAGMEQVYPKVDVVCAADAPDEAEKFINALGARILSDVTLFFNPPNNTKIPGWLKTYEIKDNLPTYYVCKNRACLPPTHELKEAARQI